MNKFTHWHVHTTYSFLDGYSVPDRLVKKAKDLGMSHLAISDHNSLAGIYEFNKSCEKHGVTPILGLESYYTWDTSILSLDKKERDNVAEEEAIKNGEEDNLYKTNKNGRKVKTKDFKKIIDKYQYDTKQYHILLLALNQNGWKNLIRLQAEASEKCVFNGRYILDEKILRKYSEDVVCTSACIGGIIPTLINEERFEEAEKQIDTMKEIFGDRFYLELQPLNIEKQWISNYYLIKYAREKNIKLVATNDVHYVEEDDHDDHDTLLCIGTGRLKKEQNRMKYSNDYWLRSYDEMVEAFTMQANCMMDQVDGFDVDEYSKAIKEAIENTNSIIDLLEPVKLGSDTPLLPQFKVPDKYKNVEQLLTLKCFESLYAYKKEKPQIDINEYQQRLNHELNIINRKGYASYMLIVEDYIKNGGADTGPGRGSAAGSLVLFLLGITKVDPIEYDLLFFRFLTEDRTELPDIDTDFCYFKRDNVIRYLEEKYNKENVAHIGTFTRLGVKNGIKDVGRVLDYPFTELNRITKSLDNILDKPQPKFKDFDELKNSANPAEQKAWKEFNKIETKYKKIFELARKFEGISRNAGVHASAVLVTPIPIMDMVPVRIHEDGTTICLFDGDQLEDLNLVKFDILGLKTVSLLRIILEQVSPDISLDDLLKEIDFDNPELYDMINDLKTDGLFQIESNLFKQLIKGIKPDNFNDIIALTSIARPGPLSAGMHDAYGKRKSGQEEAVEPLKNTWDFTGNSYGTIIYQEQIMQIAREVAGVNGNQADSYYRKAIARNNQEIMDMCRQWFIYGKINEAPPIDYDESNINQPMYDPDAKHGTAITGGLNNGYDETTLSEFWEQMKGYVSYLFNLSHAVSYSFITIACAYLKRYYPTEYMATLLSITDIDEDKERYIVAANKMGIDVVGPDINKSETHFTVNNGQIIYGLSSIKGIGDTKIKKIIDERPYKDLEDVMNKLPKNVFDKRVGQAMIKSGCFDFEDENRHIMLNKFWVNRKTKKEIEEETLDPKKYNKYVCMEFERETLSTEIKYKTWWDDLKTGATVNRKFVIDTVSEIYDKNNRLMAFVSGIAEEVKVDMVIFSYIYSNSHGLFKKGNTINIIGRKDDSEKLIIEKATKPVETVAI